MTSDSPFFSIIIPTYNRAHLIGRAIESVLGQTFKDWELIIVDDGSTDDTSAKVLAFQDERIRYVWQENAELNAARNMGIQAHKGVYLCFLDDDDLFLPEHLEVHFKEISKLGMPLGVFHSGIAMLYQSKESYAVSYSASIHLNPVRYQWDVGMNLLPLTFHREIFSKHIFDPRFVLWDDAHFLIRVLLDYPLFQIFGPPTAQYFVHQESRTLKYSQKGKVENNMLCIEDLQTKYGNRLKEHGIEDYHFRVAKERSFLHFANIALRTREVQLAYYYLIEAVRLKSNLKGLKGYVKFIVKSVLIILSYPFGKYFSKSKF
jgi:glycosyltransferase involved in cell wall biosynthesis